MRKKIKGDKVRVSKKTGIIVIAGKIINSKFKVDKDGVMFATYYVQTTGIDWTDPTGQKGAENVKWTISAWNHAADAADPHDYISEMFPDETPLEPKTHIVIEAIPENESKDIWRTKDNKPRESIKLKALFAVLIDQERLINTIEYHPRGTMYPPWWRPDIYEDDDPAITGKYDEHDYGLGFQDDMRSDMEFFYEDERWSRD